MGYILCIRAGKITPGKTGIVHSIQQVGFTAAVGTANAHNPLSEVKLPPGIVTELRERYGLEKQHWAAR